MYDNIIDHVNRMKVTLPIMEVMKILQQKENLINALEKKILGEIDWKLLT